MERKGESERGSFYFIGDGYFWIVLMGLSVDCGDNMSVL